MTPDEIEHLCSLGDRAYKISDFEITDLMTDVANKLAYGHTNFEYEISKLSEAVSSRLFEDESIKNSDPYMLQITKAVSSLTSISTKTMQHSVYCKAITTRGSVCIGSSNRNGYCHIHSKLSPPECIVCYEDVWKPVKMKCNHSICEDCFIKWFICGNNCTCPMCREDTKEADRYAQKKMRLDKNIVKLLMNVKFAEGDAIVEQTINIYRQVLNNPTFLLEHPMFHDSIRKELANRKGYGTLNKMFEAFNEKYPDCAKSFQFET